MTIYMTVGVAGVGKSTEIQKYQQAKVFSSDEYRLKMYGSLTEGNKHNGEIFNQLHKDMHQSLKNNPNQDIIFDATNLSRKSRIAFYKEYSPHTNIVILYFVKPKAVIKAQNAQREGDKKVPDYVIDRMYKQQQPPRIGVDCDAYEVIAPDFVKEDIDVSNIDSIEELRPFIESTWLDEFDRNFAPHDTPYHLEDINEHINMTIDDAKKNHSSLKNVALFHDLGKGVAKEVGDNGIAHYLGHENIGANYALIMENQFDDLDDSLSEAIFHHMLAHQGISQKVINREGLETWELQNYATFAEIDFRARIPRNGMRKEAE